MGEVWAFKLEYYCLQGSFFGLESFLSTPDLIIIISGGGTGRD